VKCKCCYFEKFISNNDELEKFARGFYIQQKEGERERESGETEIERVRVRGRA
jgi:hypothetical protein